MTRYVYRDLIGCEACISERRGGAFRLVAYTPYGTVFHDKTYETFRGARIALGKIGSCWRERR